MAHDDEAHGGAPMGSGPSKQELQDDLDKHKRCLSVDWDNADEVDRAKREAAGTAAV